MKTRLIFSLRRIKADKPGFYRIKSATLAALALPLQAIPDKKRIARLISGLSGKIYLALLQGRRKLAAVARL